MNMHILSHGTVNINVSEPYAEPIVDYRALTNPVDIAVMVENIGFLRRYLRSPDLMPYGPLETSPGADVQGADLEEWIRDSIVPSNFHPIGTAAKMPREMGGVVDEELFVYGTEKLRIADASIMPMLPGANTQQTCYMIGEKVLVSGPDGPVPGYGWGFDTNIYL
jgi:choline dehydrogenase-like flavoprotein